MSLRFKIIVGFIVVCLIWGTTWAAVQVGVQYIPPMLSAALRFCIACVVLGLWIAVKRLPFPRSKEVWKLVFIVCATSFTIPFALIYWGQTQVASGLASILFATFPFWAVLLSNIFLPEERIGVFHWIGLVLGFSGIVLIFHNSFAQSYDNLFLVMAAIVGSAFIESSTLIALRKYRQHVDPIVLNFWSMLFGAIILLSASVMFEHVSVTVFDLRSIASLVYLGTFGTVATFVIYFWLARRVEAIILSLIAFITPVVALVIGVLWMGEQIGIEEIIGASIVLTAIVIANFSELQAFVVKEKISLQKEHI
jgi:drug/metabolite transporter (DMT)-like permease